jgi:hypothetical protein
VTVRWTTAFLDLPADVHAAGVEFWLGSTATELSAPRGEDGRFATFLPADGDAFLRVQRVDEPAPRVHLDLHVDDVWEALPGALALGATEVFRDDDHVVLRSPGGFVLCLVAWNGEVRRPGPVDGALLDQVALDVPAHLHAAEVAFWAALTGWEPYGTDEPELTLLRRPPGMPLRLLLQRLGEDDPRATTTAHLDLAAGDGRTDRAQRDAVRGARVVRTTPYWVVMADPAGTTYCLTARPPVVGGP